MKKYLYPLKNGWRQLTSRPEMKSENLDAIVTDILNSVKKHGDSSLIDYTKKFDGVSLSQISVSEQEINKVENNVDIALKEAIKKAYNNILKFHEIFIPETKEITTSTGINCWRKPTPIESVGLYIPGGTAPLFSTVLMLAIPANIAGCKKIFLCTPPDKQGNINPIILYTAKLCGINMIFKVGGAQAIAAMAFGTKTIPKADKIFGPGNQFVTAAKQLVARMGTAIDMPAGPSEVCVIADDSANPVFVAADLLSQAEHGIDSQVLCLTNSEKFSSALEKEINLQLEQLPRKEIASKALENSSIIILNSIDEAIDLSNLYAPEHLIINCKNARAISEKITNAGSVFIGPYTPESAGDYASGTNHTLPTNGYARSYSGLSVESFMKHITFQEISKVGIKDIGPVIEIMAAEEQLFAHKNAVTLRLNELNNG